MPMFPLVLIDAASASIGLIRHCVADQQHANALVRILAASRQVDANGGRC